MLDFAVYVRYMPSRRLRRLDKPLIQLAVPLICMASIVQIKQKAHLHPRSKGYQIAAVAYGTT